MQIQNVGSKIGLGKKKSRFRAQNHSILNFWVTEFSDFEFMPFFIDLHQCVAQWIGIDLLYLCTDHKNRRKLSRQKYAYHRSFWAILRNDAIANSKFWWCKCPIIFGKANPFPAETFANFVTYFPGFATLLQPINNFNSKRSKTWLNDLHRLLIEYNTVCYFLICADFSNTFIF